MNNSSIVRICLIVFAAVFMAPNAQAQNNTNPGNTTQGVFMAVLDMDVVLSQSTALKSIREQIAKFQTTLKKELEADKAKLDSANAELKRKKSLQTQEQFKAEQEKFQQSVVDWKRKAQQGNVKLAQVRTKATGKVEGVVSQVLKDLVAKNNITMVFDKRATFASNPDMDITKIVADELNKRLPSVSVDNPWKK